MSAENQPHTLRTRDCVDPWKMALVKADGRVSLCCWGVDVGNIRETPLGELLAGHAARAARQRLLTGELGQDCLQCPGRGWTSPSALRERVEQYVRSERERRDLVAHSATLARELAALRQHAAEIETRLAETRAHADTITRERDALRAHAAALAQQAAGLERELERGPVGLWRRLTGPLKTLLRRRAASTRSAGPSEGAAR